HASQVLALPAALLIPLGERQVQYPARLLPRLTRPAPRRMLPPKYHKKDAGEKGAAYGQHLWASVSHYDLGRIARWCSGGGGRRLPATARTHRGGYSGRTGPSATRSES